MVADAHRGMASQASHSEGLWKNHTKCCESTDTYKVFRVGGGITALAPGSSRSLFNSVDFPRSAEEGSPAPTILERFPHPERQKHQTAFSNNPSWSKVWDGNLLHLENQRWFCCCCCFLFQQSREENIYRKHRRQKNYYLVCWSHRWPIIHQRVTSLRLPRGSGCFWVCLSTNGFQASIQSEEMVHRLR